MFCFGLYFTVAGAENEQCGRHETLRLNSSHGYIASSVTMETNLGSYRCPWIISVLPGQRINLTLLTFDLPQGHPSLMTSAHCQLYARVRDKGSGSGSDVNICKGHSREKTVFVSKTNQIHLEIVSNLRDKDTDNFIIKYEGISIDFVFTYLLNCIYTAM